MLDKGEYSEDPSVNKKLYDLHHETKVMNSVRNDNQDLNLMCPESLYGDLPIVSLFSDDN
jgi:hypothetical protein